VCSFTRWSSADGARRRQQGGLLKPGGLSVVPFTRLPPALMLPGATRYSQAPLCSEADDPPLTLFLSSCPVPVMLKPFRPLLRAVFALISIGVPTPLPSPPTRMPYCWFPLLFSPARFFSRTLGSALVPPLTSSPSPPLAKESFSTSLFPAPTTWMPSPPFPRFRSPEPTFCSRLS